MPVARGTFEITSMSEDSYHEADDESRLARARGTQRFSGDVEGVGEVEWLCCYTPGGHARLVGLQRISGSVGGHRGAVVIEASAAHDGTRSTGTWTVVDGSGTHDLAGIRGSGGFEAAGASVTYHLEYDLA